MGAVGTALAIIERGTGKVDDVISIDIPVDILKRMEDRIRMPEKLTIY